MNERSSVPLETLRQVAKQLGLSAAGDAAAVRQRIEDAGGGGFIDALVDQQRQELAAAQHVLRNNPTPLRLLTPDVEPPPRLPTPELDVPAPVGENAPPAPPGATPTAAALGQAGEPQRPGAPTRVDRETAIEVPAPVGSSQTPLPVPAAIGAAQTPLPMPAMLPMGGTGGTGGTALSSPATVPMGGAGPVSTAPQPTLPTPAGTAATVAAGLGNPPSVQPMPAATPSRPLLSTPAPGQTPNAAKPLTTPAPLRGLLGGIAGHVAGQLGAHQVLPGLTADRLLGFAGLPSTGAMASNAAEQLLGGLGGGGMDWSEVLGLGGGKRGEASSATEPAGGDSGAVAQKLDKIIELLQKLVDRETRTDQLGPQADGSFRPSLSTGARQAAMGGTVQAGAGIADSIAGTASADTSAMVAQAVARALTMAVAAV